MAEAHFPGADVILNQLRVGSATIRVGLRSQGRIPLHGGMTLHSTDGKNIGRITSGSFAPSVGAPLAMGYVNRDAAEPGTSLAISVRDREHHVMVTALPFIAARHHRN
jgi:aminomethyltransferase